MDTKPLERFASWARLELITVVDAQASAILADGSLARTERLDAVRRLESEIEHHGRPHVVDRVAYIWFNRIIALRFMDARGYTDAGIVSPAQGQEHGLPEVLADAKRGNLDPGVITSTRTADVILGLLDGTRHSTDPEGEAYALLLTEYCRYWHKSMPFMFEREGDFTEMLVPANLLADGAILSRARQALTEDVCEDVEVIGWLYQFYISERKQEIFDSKAKRGPDEIPAATQLFTPHWIVRYLGDNSVGRLWMLNRPDSRLIDQMVHYIAPVREEVDYLKISGVNDLTVIDPACGSGHMLTYAFDLLYAIYEEVGYAPSEIPALILANNLQGTEIDPRAGSLAAFALTMKARAADRRFFTRKIVPKICVIEPIEFRADEIDVIMANRRDRATGEAFWNQFKHADTLGSLLQPAAASVEEATRDLQGLKEQEETLYSGTLRLARKVIAQAEVLSSRYSVVVANPPYMTSSKMNDLLGEFGKEFYPNSKSDLFAMFIERCLAFSLDRGIAAMITMQTWMFLSSYEDLRSLLIKTAPPSSMLHLGERAFDSIGGSVVSTTAFVLERSRNQAHDTVFIRAVEGRNEAEKLQILLAAVKNEKDSRWLLSPKQLGQIPGSPVAYWLSEDMRAAFNKGSALKDIAEPRQGMSTADNARFVRQWWEVSQRRSEYRAFDTQGARVSNRRWFPYTDGGDFRRWYGNRWAVVNWENGGEELRGFKRSVVRNPGYYFASSVSWSAVGSGVPAFRSTPEGSVFSNAGMSLFGTDEQLETACAVCNSTTAEKLLAAIAPTLNLGVGEIGRLPIAPVPDTARHRVRSLVSCARQDWDDFETSWDFKRPSWLTESVGGRSLAERYASWSATQLRAAREQHSREIENNRAVAEAYGLGDEVPVELPLSKVSLTRNIEFLFGEGRNADEYAELERAQVASELVSYAVGCMFGRYSLDAPGLILADQGETIQNHVAMSPNSTFLLDKDNVVPVVDGDWFEDDIVDRFRQFLRSAFGEEYLEENLGFVTDSLGVKDIRTYFLKSFYKDHVQKYKSRPIYWLFSSPKGSFNALIYMHRYTPSTVSTVLNEYLREYRAKLEVALEDAEQAGAGGSAKDAKEAERLRQVLVELRDYERDILHPLAMRQLPIDLDDGVQVNYLRFGRALKDIGLEKYRSKVEDWTWPRYPLEAAN